MEHKKITEYQNWARRGYLTLLKCNEKDHPPLLADPLSLELIVKCVLCDFRREIGLREYTWICRCIESARLLFENEK